MGIKRPHAPKFNSLALRPRRGLAVAELAVCLPLLTALTFGTVDLCAAMFLKETVTLAAYEAARVGVERGGTNADAIRRAQEFLDERGVSYNTNSIRIQGSSFESAGTLEHVTVVISVECDDNLSFAGTLCRGMQITGRVTMRKEFANQ